MSDKDNTTASDVQRMKKLESELHRLVAAVDARLSAPPAPRLPRDPSTGQAPRVVWPKSGDRFPAAAMAGLAVLLFTAGWAGSSLFYGSRLSHQVEDELRPYATELAETVTTIQTDLAPQLAAADELKAEIDQARRDLLARDEDMDKTITDAQSQLLTIRDTAIDDIEQRLSDQTDDLSTMLETSRRQAMALDQGLSEVSQALAAFHRQLPVLTDGFGEVAAGVMDTKAALEQTEQNLASLDDQAPPLMEAVQKHQKTLDHGSKTLSILQAQLEALKTQTARSSDQLDQVLAQGRGRLSDWEDVDRQIAGRKEEIMRNLDHYADSLNARVREFIEALNVEPTFTGG